MICVDFDEGCSRDEEDNADKYRVSYADRTSYLQEEKSIEQLLKFRGCNSMAARTGHVTITPRFSNTHLICDGRVNNEEYDIREL